MGPIHQHRKKKRFEKLFKICAVTIATSLQTQERQTQTVEWIKWNASSICWTHLNLNWSKWINAAATNSCGWWGKWKQMQISDFHLAMHGAGPDRQTISASLWLLQSRNAYSTHTRKNIIPCARALPRIVMNPGHIILLILEIWFFSIVFLTAYYSWSSTIELSCRRQTQCINIALTIFQTDISFDLSKKRTNIRLWYYQYKLKTTNWLLKSEIFLDRSGDWSISARSVFSHQSRW